MSLEHVTSYDPSEPEVLGWAQVPKVTLSGAAEANYVDQLGRAISAARLNLCYLESRKLRSHDLIGLEPSSGHTRR